MSPRSQTAIIRQQIIEAADNLLYHKGFHLMSFSDLAAASGIPRGNLNYHFKTKVDILEAVIEHRLQCMQDMLADWDKTLADPHKRLRRFVQILLNELDNITRFGCPIGSLNTELKKTEPALQAITLRQLSLFRDWLTQQFRELGKSKTTAAHLAIRLLARTQGIVVLASAWQDEALLRYEVAAVNSWISKLASGNNFDRV